MLGIRFAYGMELRCLNVFVEVVRCGGFTAASHRLHLTQPSISRAIKQLEDDVGQVLITRKHRDIHLTDAGKILYQRAMRMLKESSALESEMADLVGLRRGVITLGIPPLGGTLFVPFIKRFKEKYPEIELLLSEKGSKATESALASSELELGTLMMPVDEDQYQSIMIASDRLVLAVPSTSPWAKKTAVKLAELKDESFILYPEGFGLNDRIISACREVGFDPKIASRSSHAQLIVGLVDSGLGLAFLPGAVAREIPNIVAREINDPVLEWNIALAWPIHSYLSHAARAMVAMARETGLNGTPPKAAKPAK